MGAHQNIDFNRFPEQGNYLNAIVWVCFNRDIYCTILGKIIRDDIEAPWQTLIQLWDGRVVTASECQYRHTLDTDPTIVFHTTPVAMIQNRFDPYVNTTH